MTVFAPSRRTWIVLVSNREQRATITAGRPRRGACGDPGAVERQASGRGDGLGGFARDPAAQAAARPSRVSRPAPFHGRIGPGRWHAARRSGRPASAASGCSTSWSWSDSGAVRRPNSRPRPPRTRWWPKPRPPGPGRRSPATSARSRPAGRCQSTCRGSGS